jgi:hypothetical protein
MMLSVRVVPLEVVKVRVPVQSGFTVTVPSNSTPVKETQIRDGGVELALQVAGAVHAKGADGGDVAARKEGLFSHAGGKHPAAGEHARAAFIGRVAAPGSGAEQHDGG